ncbi:hypothetical protein INR49_024797 [Caranx melampygus]|nr:hypothetical protein INR49_024797 [Caranx melampygus]
MLCIALKIVTRIVCVAAGAGVVTESWVVVISEMIDVTHAVGGVVGGSVRRQAGLPIPHQHRHRHPPGRRQRHHLQALVLPLPLALVVAKLSALPLPALDSCRSSPNSDAAADDMSRRGSCFRRASMQEEEEDGEEEVGAVLQQSIREETSRGDTITS